MSELFTYEGSIFFKSDAILTQEQIDQLIAVIALQIVEPVDIENEDENYSTESAKVSLSLVSWVCALCGAEMFHAKEVLYFSPWGETCAKCGDEIRGAK